MMMAAWRSLFTKRRLLPQVATQFARILNVSRPPQYVGCLPAARRGLHGSARSRVGEKGSWGKSSPLAPEQRGLHGSARSRAGEQGSWGKSSPRSPEQQQQYHHELDKADALMLRKSHETGFLSWFRNGLLATGIGVIAFVQSDVGREAGYAFFILGGVCVSFGAASYVVALLTLRRLMLLSVPAVMLYSSVVSSIALFWLCAVSLYIGRLEVEIIHDGEEEEDEDEEECRECRERREHRGYRRGSHDDRHGNKGSDNKGQDK